MIAQFARSSRTWTTVAVLLVLTLGLVALTDAVQAEQAAATTRPAAVDPHVSDVEAERAVPGRAFKAVRNGAGMPEEAATSATVKSGDLVAVSIMNLVGEGVETTKTSRVDGEGNINLPYVGQVKVQGLKPHEVEKAVAKAFVDRNLVRDAVVAVSLPERGESHQLTARRQVAAEEAAAPLLPGGFDPSHMDPAMMDAADPRGAPMAAQPIDPALQAALDRKLPETKFDNVPLTDVIDFLRETTSTNVFVNWRALEAAGIDRAAPVSLNVRNVAFKDVLALVLKEQGGGGALQYGIENGVITIDAAHAPAKAPKLVTKAYDVRDLLAAGGGGLFGGGGGGGGGEGGDSASNLVRTIYETVSPQTWRVQGGSGNVSTYGTKLIVTAADDVHREVMSLLEMLRENPQPAAATTTTKPAEHGVH